MPLPWIIAAWSLTGAALALTVTIGYIVVSGMTHVALGHVEPDEPDDLGDV